MGHRINIHFTMAQVLESFVDDPLPSILYETHPEACIIASFESWAQEQVPCYFVDGIGILFIFSKRSV